MKLVVCNLIVIIQLLLCDSARILAVMPMPAYSHQIMFRPLWKELLKRGHEITLLTTDPMQDVNFTNLKQIDWSTSYKIKYEKYDIAQTIQRTKNLFKVYYLMGEMYKEILDEEMGHPEVQALLKSKHEKFDLVIVEYFLPVFFAFSNHFNCPYIGVASFDIPNAQHKILGNFVHPALFPELFLPFDRDLNFLQRVVSALISITLDILTEYSLNDRSKLDQYFGSDMPHLKDIMKNASLILTNVDPALYLRPLGPSTITIGGKTHMEDVKPLPNDLKLFMDNAKNGVVYFSLGSSVKSKDLSLGTVKTVLEVFQSLPYEVLWKFENDTLPNIPKNVKLAKWLPQQDVLRHPNMKVFITQGGLQSIEEAIFSYVPMVGVPFVGDQRRNVARLQHMGIAVALDKEDLNKKDVFKSAILEVINNPKYKTKIEEVASLSLDQPMTGLEKAVWWTEYVIRHKGAKHLRSPVVDMPAYQYYLLDVLAFLSVTLLVVLFIIYKIIQIIVRLFRKIKLKLKKD